MTCQILTCVVDQRTPRFKGQPYRPGKSRPGEFICLKERKKEPVRWGRMEGPLGGSMILEVTGASYADLKPYTRKLTNLPHLHWGLYGNHVRVEVLMPPWEQVFLKDHEREYLRSCFPKTCVNVTPYGAIFDLYTEKQVRFFPKAFELEWRDKFIRKFGPRWVLDERVCQKIAWDGGFGRCNLDTFKANVHDRAQAQPMQMAA